MFQNLKISGQIKITVKKQAENQFDMSIIMPKKMCKKHSINPAVK